MVDFEVSESLPKKLYTEMPVMWLIPTADRKQPDTGMYLCPVYKTLTRAGVIFKLWHQSFRLQKPQDQKRASEI